MSYLQTHKVKSAHICWNYFTQSSKNQQLCGFISFTVMNNTTQTREKKTKKQDKLKDGNGRRKSKGLAVELWTFNCQLRCRQENPKVGWFVSLDTAGKEGKKKKKNLTRNYHPRGNQKMGRVGPAHIQQLENEFRVFLTIRCFGFLFKATCYSLYLLLSYSPSGWSHSKTVQTRKTSDQS